MNLKAEFERLIEAFEESALPYALAGGLAVAVWGAPRATKDIDLLILPSDFKAVRQLAATLGYNIEASPMSFNDGMEIRRISKLEGRDYLTLDLLLVNASVEAAWNSRQYVSTNSGRLCVVSRQALIDMKARSARPQDLYDIERLKDYDR